MTASFKGTSKHIYIVSFVGCESQPLTLLCGKHLTMSLLIEEIPPRLESRQKLAEQKAGSCWSTDRLMHLLARN